MVFLHSTCVDIGDDNDDDHDDDDDGDDDDDDEFDISLKPYKKS